MYALNEFVFLCYDDTFSFASCMCKNKRLSRLYRAVDFNSNNCTSRLGGFQCGLAGLMPQSCNVCTHTVNTHRAQTMRKNLTPLPPRMWPCLKHDMSKIMENYRGDGTRLVGVDTSDVCSSAKAASSPGDAVGVSILMTRATAVVRPTLPSESWLGWGSSSTPSRVGAVAPMAEVDDSAALARGDVELATSGVRGNTHASAHTHTRRGPIPLYFVLTARRQGVFATS